MTRSFTHAVAAIVALTITYTMMSAAITVPGDRPATIIALA